MNKQQIKSLQINCHVWHIAFQQSPAKHYTLSTMHQYTFLFAFQVSLVILVSSTRHASSHCRLSKGHDVNNSSLKSPSSLIILHPLLLMVHGHLKEHLDSSTTGILSSYIVFSQIIISSLPPTAPRWKTFHGISQTMWAKNNVSLPRAGIL